MIATDSEGQPWQPGTSIVVLLLVLGSGATDLLSAATARAASDVPAASQPTASSAAPPSYVRRVIFETDDEVPIQLVATYAPPAGDSRKRRAPVVILLHDAGEDRSRFDPLFPALHRAGLATLAIDLRGHGESVEPAVLKLRPRAQRHDPKLFRDMQNDIQAAYRWLVRRPEIDPARFVLVGVGVGGGIALDYAVRDKSVDGVVVLAPKLDEVGPDPIASARKFTMRRLLLVSTPSDRAAVDAIGPLVAKSVVKHLAARSVTASGQIETGDSTRLFGHLPGLETVVTEFCLETAGPASAAPVVASLKGSTYYDPASRQADRLTPENLRYFSSAVEAQTRGYQPPKSRQSAKHKQNDETPMTE